MTPGALLHGLDRVGCQVVGEEIEDEQHQRRPCVEVDGNLQRGVALETFFHHDQLKSLKVLPSNPFEIWRELLIKASIRWRRKPLRSELSIIFRQIHTFIQMS